MRLRTRSNRTMLHSQKRMPAQAIPATRDHCCLSSGNNVERLLQWWDELDDLVGVVGLASERIRNLSVSVGLACAGFLLPLGGIALALSHPPLALASAIILFVTLLYRSVTTPLEIAG